VVLSGANDTVNGAHTRQAVADLAATLGQAKILVSSLNSGADPALRQLPKIARDLETTMSKTDVLIGSINSGYGTNTVFNRSLERLLLQLNDAVSSIRALADLLTRHPEALIRGRAGGGRE
jgi:paraquat-inducible protein B